MGADTYTISAISGTTITLSSNLTSNYSGSGAYEGYVSQLTDKSGQGNNATQSTTSQMPLWLSNGMNGIGTASFNGAVGGDVLDLNTLTTPTDFTYFSTAYRLAQTTDNGSGVRPIFSNNGNDTGAFIGVPREDITNNSLEAGWYAGTGTNTGSGTWAVNTAQIAFAYMNNSNGNVSIGLSGTSASTTLTTSATTTPSYIGGDGGWDPDARHFNGNISDAIMYSGPLSTNAQALVNQYESAKWGVALTPPGTGATEAAKAMASDGYSVFTTRYLERLSNSANITLSASNNINLDFKGDTMTLNAGRNLSLTAGNTISNASSGTINTSQSGASGGNITFAAGADIALNGFTLNSHGGNVILDANTAGSGGAIALTGGSAINSAGGAITLGGNEATPANIIAGTGYAVGDPTYVQGIAITSATVNSGAGNIIMNGQGYASSAANGATTSPIGILLNGGNVQASGTGTVTLNATAGGAGAGGDDHGVFVYNTSAISTVNGALSVTGTSGTGSGGGNYGVILSGTGTNSITATGTGTVTISGTSQGTGGSGIGVARKYWRRHDFVRRRQCKRHRQRQHLRYYGH